MKKLYYILKSWQRFSTRAPPFFLTLNFHLKKEWYSSFYHFKVMLGPESHRLLKNLLVLKKFHYIEQQRFSENFRNFPFLTSEYGKCYLCASKMNVMHRRACGV